MMVPKEKDLSNETPTSSEAENRSVDRDKNNSNSNGSTETNSNITEIRATFGRITDIKWEDLEAIDDDEDSYEDADESEITEINYTFDPNMNPEEVGKQIHQCLSEWIENEMQLSTITKIEAATAAMNFVFFNNEQCQEYKNMIRAVQEALKQLKSGIRSKIDKHVCFDGDHHKRLLEMHLRTESRNAMDDLDNFFDPEKYQDETTEMGRQLTEQGIARVILLYRNENDDVVEHERKLTSESIAKIMQRLPEKFHSTLMDNNNKIENEDSSLEEIQKRLKNSCLKSFNKAFDFEERVNEVRASAENKLDTEIQREMQKIMQRQNQENDLGADSNSLTDVLEVGSVTPISYEKGRISQQIEKFKPPQEKVEDQQGDIPPQEQNEPTPLQEPQSMKKTNYVAATRNLYQNLGSSMQPLDTPKLVRSLLSTNLLSDNSIIQVKVTCIMGESPTNYMIQKIPKNEVSQVSQLPNGRSNEKVDSTKTGKPESDLSKAYKTYVPRQQRIKPILKKYQWPPQSENVKQPEEAPEQQQEEIQPTQKIELSRKTPSPQKTHYDGMTQKIPKEEASQDSLLPKDHREGKVDCTEAEKSKSDFHKSTVPIQQGLKPIEKKYKWPPQNENPHHPEDETEKHQGKVPPTQETDPWDKPQSPQNGSYVKTVQEKFQHIEKSMQPKNIPKPVQMPLSKNSLKLNSPQQVKEPSNLAKAPVNSMIQKFSHTNACDASSTPIEHQKPNADSGVSGNSSKISPKIQAAQDKIVNSFQEQPAYNSLNQFDRGQLRQRQNQQVENTSKGSELHSAIHKQTPQSHLVHQSSTARHEPATKNYLSNVVTNAKSKIFNDTASDNKQKSILSEPKDKVIQKLAAASTNTSNNTAKVENETKRPMNKKFDNIFQQKNSLKLKCDDMDLLMKNQKFVVGSDTLLKTWKKVVTDARDVASSSMVEEDVSRQIEIIERTRGDLLKAVVGRRY